MTSRFLVAVVVIAVVTVLDARLLLGEVGPAGGAAAALLPWRSSCCARYGCCSPCANGRRPYGLSVPPSFERGAVLRTMPQQLAIAAMGGG